jgi:hypothetical protein
LGDTCDAAVRQPVEELQRLGRPPLGDQLVHGLHLLERQRVLVLVARELPHDPGLRSHGGHVDPAERLADQLAAQVDVEVDDLQPALRIRLEDVLVIVERSVHQEPEERELLPVHRAEAEELVAPRIAHGRRRILADVEALLQPGAEVALGLEFPGRVLQRPLHHRVDVEVLVDPRPLVLQDRRFDLLRQLEAGLVGGLERRQQTPERQHGNHRNLLRIGRSLSHEPHQDRRPL